MDDREYEDRMESYLENHAQDHDEELAEIREAMDMRDHFDQYGYE